MLCEASSSAAKSSQSAAPAMRFPSARRLINRQARSSRSFTAGTGVAASHPRKGNHCFLVLVNRDIQQHTTAIIEFTDSTPAVQVARVAKDGAYHPLPAGLLKTNIDPVDVAILSWETERGE